MTKVRSGLIHCVWSYKDGTPSTTVANACTRFSLARLLDIFIFVKLILLDPVDKLAFDGHQILFSSSPWHRQFTRIPRCVRLAVECWWGRNKDNASTSLFKLRHTPDGCSSQNSERPRKLFHHKLFSAVSNTVTTQSVSSPLSYTMKGMDLWHASFGP